MASVQINVTQDHIKRGKPGSACTCAVALAIIYATGKWGNVTVSDVGIHIAGYEPVKTPAHVADWIVRFDSGQPVEPISFEIELVEVADEAVMV